MKVRRPAIAAALAAMLALPLAGCAMSSPRSDALDSLAGLQDPDEMTVSSSPPSTDDTDPSATPTTTVSTPPRDCIGEDLATSSYRPDANGNVDDEFVEEIRQRGFVEVGVDKNTLGFSVRDSATGEYEGFEVDLAHEVAKRIFGAADYDEARVRFIPVGSSQKRQFVIDGTVDFTISANTMTCERWEEVAFSSEYYTANQEFLVRTDSDLRTVDDLAGATVCVTDSSSSQDILESFVPDAIPIVVDERIDCLVEIQEGRADAYFGHDSFQYGMQVQHPGLVMRSILPADLTVSHYGIAIALDHPGFVRFVNAVLEEVRTDGTWQTLHQQLQDQDGPNIPPATAPPAAEYRD